ncbi:fungal-specific transcription factor domain-containing protein [Xylaria sp. FL1777]|nr:fungal-specific transcription factor domain-containing protein [Xylaria sp. FL1777]
MESRGDAVNADSSRRLAIRRRSCDQCRSRKVRCDRGSPCSNCVSAKLACSFGVVASRTTAAKQRVLISAHYERKIDDIAEGVEAIKAFLLRQEREETLMGMPISEPAELSESDVNMSGDLTGWEHSAQVNDFVRTVAEDRASREDSGAEESQVLASLKNLAWALEESDAAGDALFPGTRDAKPLDHRSMPPVEPALHVYWSWAEEHKMFFRIESLSRILPLQTFTDICTRVYYVGEGYSQLDFILANSYLSYLFCEYIAVTGTGRDELQAHSKRCRHNAQVALSQLPLLLPATEEAVAALIFGASHAIECSKATLAWTYISSAANLCQTMGFHRLAADSKYDDDPQGTRASLFWLVLLLEKSLSLRLGRPSNFRDDEITTPLPSEAGIRRCAQTSIIQGKIYDLLYSPTGLARSDIERGMLAQNLASELRGIINENKIAFQNSLLPPGAEQDKMRDVYYKIELVKQLSLLTLILRAVPAPMGSLTSITDECAAAAHETLDMHHQCMAAIKDNNKDDWFMSDRYLHWGVLHTPFVPFSVLFTRIVQLSNSTDLFYLDRFSESLQLEGSSAESITHPYRLYKLLCQAARLYIKQDPPRGSYEVDTDSFDPWSVFDFASFGNEANDGANGSGLDHNPSQDLSHWFHGHQQLMGVLDDDIMF